MKKNSDKSCKTKQTVLHKEEKKAVSSKVKKISGQHRRISKTWRTRNLKHPLIKSLFIKRKAKKSETKQPFSTITKTF